MEIQKALQTWLSGLAKIPCRVMRTDHQNIPARSVSNVKADCVWVKETEIYCCHLSVTCESNPIQDSCLTWGKKIEQKFCETLPIQKAPMMLGNLWGILLRLERCRCFDGGEGLTFDKAQDQSQRPSRHCGCFRRLQWFHSPRFLWHRISPELRTQSVVHCTKLPRMGDLKGWMDLKTQREVARQREEI